MNLSQYAFRKGMSAKRRSFLHCFPCSDLGAHIDGFIAVAAHSVLVQGEAKSPVEGQAADVLQAANTALEAALRLIRPGKLVSEVCCLSQLVSCLNPSAILCSNSSL